MIFSKRLNRRGRFVFGSLRLYLKRILPIILVIGLFFLLKNQFTVRKIVCTFNGGPCSAEISLILDKLLETNFLFVNQNKINQKIAFLYQVRKTAYTFKPFHTLVVEVEGDSSPLPIEAYLVNELPVLSLDKAPSTTDSAGWWRMPTQEIAEYLNAKEAGSFNLYQSGTMTPSATAESKLKMIFSTKPSTEVAASIYDLVRVVSKYLEVSAIYVIDQRCFLSRPNQPDIIVVVPFDEAKLVSALQSLSYLVTIKKDLRVIDLSFKNPVLR